MPRAKRKRRIAVADKVIKQEPIDPAVETTANHGRIIGTLTPTKMEQTSDEESK